MSKNTFTIHTPEGISFDLELAGPIARFLALGIDLACITLTMNILRGLLAFFAAFSFDLSMALFYLLNFLVTIGYAIIFEWRWGGQTLGKKVLRIRVMDIHGLRLTFAQVMMRNLLRVVDSIPSLYLVAGISSFINKKNQRLGDIAANTMVIQTPRTELPSLEENGREKFNSLLSYPHLAARLRRSVPPHLAALALSGLSRRDQLLPQARIRLFKELSAYFTSIISLPGEITEGLPDEQLVRDIVEVLYKPGKAAAV